MGGLIQRLSLLSGSVVWWEQVGPYKCPGGSIFLCGSWPERSAFLPPRSEQLIFRHAPVCPALEPAGVGGWEWGGGGGDGLKQEPEQTSPSSAVSVCILFHLGGN